MACTAKAGKAAYRIPPRPGTHHREHALEPVDQAHWLGQGAETARQLHPPGPHRLGPAQALQRDFVELDARQPYLRIAKARLAVMDAGRSAEQASPTERLATGGIWARRLAHPHGGFSG